MTHTRARAHTHTDARAHALTLARESFMLPSKITVLIKCAVCEYQNKAVISGTTSPTAKVHKMLTGVQSESQTNLCRCDAAARFFRSDVLLSRYSSDILRDVKCIF